VSEWSDRFSNEIYRGMWRFMVPWLKVPAEPPDLPAGGGSERVERFQPAPGFLSYMKFWFWILAVIIDLAILIVWIIISVANIFVGLALSPIMLIIMFLPDVIAFVAMHVRYDTTWYAMTDRAVRIRRGVWVIHETTISFENVQNVKVTQGPVQRHFGIANVVIETAGSGGAAQGKKQAFGVSNQGLIEGVADAQRIRDLILARMKASKTAGLGDEEEPERPAQQQHAAAQWTQEHVDLLREIRDALAAT